MKPILLLAIVAGLSASLVFAQAGPKEKEKAKPDSTEIEEQVEKESKPKSEPEKKKAPPPAPKIAVAKEDTSAVSTHLKRALFTTAIAEREPTGAIDSLSTADEQVYFFTEVVGFEGSTITHRWSRGDEVHAEVPIAVGSPRWRAYSSKKLLRSWTGEWRVDVLDAEGNVLGSKRFVYYAVKQAE
jgi:hypothetical protein